MLRQACYSLDKMQSMEFACFMGERGVNYSWARRRYKGDTIELKCRLRPHRLLRCALARHIQDFFTRHALRYIRVGGPAVTNWFSGCRPYRKDRCLVFATKQRCIVEEHDHLGEFSGSLEDCRYRSNRLVVADYNDTTDLFGKAGRALCNWWSWYAQHSHLRFPSHTEYVL